MSHHEEAIRKTQDLTGGTFFLLAWGKILLVLLDELEETLAWEVWMSLLKLWPLQTSHLLFCFILFYFVTAIQRQPI